MPISPKWVSFRLPNAFIDEQHKFIENIALGNRLDFELDILQKKNSTCSDPNVYINDLLTFGKLLLKNRFFDNAKKCFERVFSYQDNNFEALKNILFSEIRFDLSKHEQGEIKLLDSKEFEKALSYAPTDEEQQKLVVELLTICLKSLKIDSVIPAKAALISDKFSYLIKFYSGSDEDKNSYVQTMASLCLSVGDFKDATNYANISLQFESRTNIEARYVILLSVLKCRNEKAFLNCENFNKNMQEYKDLLMSCSKNEKRLSEFTHLADENIKNVELRLIKEKEAQEKARKEEKARAEKARLATIEQIKAQEANAAERKFKGLRISFIVLAFIVTIGFTFFFCFSELSSTIDIFGEYEHESICVLPTLTPVLFIMSIFIGVMCSVLSLLGFFHDNLLFVPGGLGIQFCNFALSAFRGLIWIKFGSYKWPVMWPHLMLLGVHVLNTLFTYVNRRIAEAMEDSAN